MRAQLFASVLLALCPFVILAMPYEPINPPGSREITLTLGVFQIDMSDTDYR